VDTTVSDPLVGQLLDGRYHVGPRLARGGMATVYEAHDNRLDRTIALKVMHPSLADDEEFVTRFIREAHSAARLSHPNVVAVYDQGADQGHVFLAMELVRGRTLRDLIRASGHLSPRQALEVLEPVLAALGAAHQAGLMHRDVKPENVLLSDDDRIKVADFGLARAVTGATSHTTTSGVLMGTVAYLSPEQVTRGVADPRSDVYAAGIVLYEMLTGSKPYDGETAIQVAYRHVHDDVPPPSALVPGLPAELDHLVARATSRDPDGRPADARRFLAEVVAARRAMSDGELDTLGPALSALSSTPDHTLVVDLTARTTTAPARRGDTGPLSHSGHGTRVRARRSRGPLALLLILALAVVLSGVAWFVAEGPLSKTTTPGLLNLTAAQAKDKAAKSGLDAAVKGHGFSEVVPVGRVLETDPARGEDIDKGGTIALILSKGPERYAVPNVVGRTEEVARSMIEDARLTVADVERKYSSKVEEGVVLSADPEAGTELKRDQAVTLVVSRGPKPVAVPSVVGLPVDQAKVAVTDAELRPEVTGKFNETVPLGTVIRQSPEGGTADKNSVVQLIVSKGPPLVAVPDLVGANVTDAQAALTAVGLVPAVQQIPAGPGTVRSQSPGGGDKIAKGSTVTLYVF
jgi:beta-lactam-binding protein with PASTA domain/tRNA A-37 threonylcarbamoyl transferase component Bud32